MSLLLATGAALNAANKYGNTALTSAAWNGHEACASMLLAAGAEVEAANCGGYTALMFAATNGHEAVVSALLVAGAEVEVADNYGFTALILAAMRGHEACVSQLLCMGAAMPQPHLASALSSVLRSENARATTTAAIQGEFRWRRRRPLALVREQRVAARDEALARKVWKHVEV